MDWVNMKTWPYITSVFVWDKRNGWLSWRYLWRLRPYTGNFSSWNYVWEKILVAQYAILLSRKVTITNNIARILFAAINVQYSTKGPVYARWRLACVHRDSSTNKRVDSHKHAVSFKGEIMAWSWDLHSGLVKKMSMNMKQYYFAYSSETCNFTNSRCALPFEGASY
jgi:hypothetical protein